MPLVAEARLSWTHADPANDAQPRDADVDPAVATQFAARARQEAVRLNRAGDYAGARRVVDDQEEPLPDDEEEWERGLQF
jgi:hypothetical protein